MRWLVAIVSVAGCGGDVCEPYSGRTCVALEVRGAVAIDQLRLDSAQLRVFDAPTPHPPRAQPFSLPVAVAVVPFQSQFAGPFALRVRGRLGGNELGEDVVTAAVAAGQHQSVVATLRAGV